MTRRERASAGQPLPVTPESIAAAYLQMLRDRAEVKAQTGIDISVDGRMLLPRVKAHRPKRWYCEMCDRWFGSRMDCPDCGLALQRAH
jgi:hypothetical protein